MRSQSSLAGLGSGESAGKTARTHAGWTLSSRVVPGPDTKIDTCSNHVQFPEDGVQAVTRRADDVVSVLSASGLHLGWRKLWHANRFNVDECARETQSTYHLTSQSDHQRQSSGGQPHRDFQNTSLQRSDVFTTACSQHFFFYEQPGTRQQASLQRRVSLEKEAFADLPRCLSYCRNGAVHCSLTLICVKLEKKE